MNAPAHRDEAGPLFLARQGRRLTDEELVRGIRDGKSEYFETVMRRYNQRLFRVARAPSSATMTRRRTSLPFTKPSGESGSPDGCSNSMTRLKGESVTGQLAALQRCRGEAFHLVAVTAE